MSVWYPRPLWSMVPGMQIARWRTSSSSSSSSLFSVYPIPGVDPGCCIHGLRTNTLCVLTWTDTSSCRAKAIMGVVVGVMQYKSWVETKRFLFRCWFSLRCYKTSLCGSRCENEGRLENSRVSTQCRPRVYSIQLLFAVLGQDVIHYVKVGELNWGCKSNWLTKPPPFGLVSCRALTAGKCLHTLRRLLLLFLVVRPQVNTLNRTLPRVWGLGGLTYVSQAYDSLALLQHSLRWQT
jgi:hypothetical protein